MTIRPARDSHALLCAMGIRDKPIAPGSPWQNGYAERLIGTIRRECVDHLIVFGEGHLRRILASYAAYYNGLRTHRALNQDAPVHRAVEPIGAITSRPVLGGLHRQYCRSLGFRHTHVTRAAGMTASQNGEQGGAVATKGSEPINGSPMAGSLLHQE